MSDVVAPPPHLARSANVSAAQADALRERAAADPEGFWHEQTGRLEWATPPAQAYDGSDFPFVRWFADGTLNVARNCVDRHVEAGHGDRAALLWEGEPGDERRLTYADLQEEVARAAHALTSLGVGRGDVVVVYLPVLVETVVVMLACARIGAVHSMVPRRVVGRAARRSVGHAHRRGLPGRDPALPDLHLRDDREAQGPRAHHRRLLGGGAALPAPCACWAGSARPSTPRRGAGCTTTSGATGARSSTPGGSPRPARRWSPRCRARRR